MAVDVTWGETCTIVETLPNNTGSAADANRIVTHNQFNVAGQINGSSTPPATLQASFVLTLTAGAATIDLRSLLGTNGGAVDGNGLRVQIVRIKNLGANAMTFAAGAANGYTGVFGATGLTVQPGGSAMVFTNDGGIDIDATHKTWDVAGTGSQTAQVTVVLG